MRIISSFKDYYDCGQSYGFDPQIVYVREEKKSNKEVKTDFSTFNIPGTNFSIEYIGFAGAIYPVFYTEKYDRKSKKYIKTSPPFFSIELLKEKLRGVKTWRKRWWDLEFKQKENFAVIFEEAPIFHASLNGYSRREVQITLNCKLGDWGFASILDPYTAYQTLSMYFGSRYFKEKDIPTVSDKDMVSIKGFDKFSFRKEKT